MTLVDNVFKKTLNEAERFKLTALPLRVKYIEMMFSILFLWIIEVF